MGGKLGEAPEKPYPARWYALALSLRERWHGE